MSDRQPMTPDEFDENVRELTRCCPWVSQTSGFRSEIRNQRVGGSSRSKHLVGMAADFAADDEDGLEQAQDKARQLGFWTQIHGSPPHLHIQGLPAGEVSDCTINWNTKWGKHGSH